MPAAIFNGANVKVLKDNLDINGKVSILTGTVDPSATATSAPAGSLYHNTSSGIIYRKTDAGSSTNWVAINSANVANAVTQAAHGFVVGDVLYLNGSTYTKARADVASTAKALGVVSAVLTANKFVLMAAGYITGLSGLTAGTTYYLSITTAGAVQATEPSVVGHVSRPVYVADSTTSAYVVPYGDTLITAAGGGSANPDRLRLDNVNGYGSTNTHIRRFLTTTTSTIPGGSFTYTDSAANGMSITINTDGLYSVSYTDQFNTSSTMGISLNSTQLTTGIGAGAFDGTKTKTSQRSQGANQNVQCSWTGWLVNGDVIRAHTDSDPVGSDPQHVHLDFIKIN